MNLIAAAPLWLTAVLCATLVAAAVEDAVRLRISNVITLVALVGAIFAALIEGPSWALWQNVAVFFGILLFGTGAFSAGWLGGGDVKLFATIGVWFDLRSVVWFLALVFLAGGVVAIGYLLSRPFRGRLGKKRGRVPYGIAIAAGALAIILLDRGVFGTYQRPLPPINFVPHHA